MTDPLLRTERLAKNFGGVEAARGVNLSVEPGEIRGLIGPNGAGKSTLCNLLSGVYSPDRGQIYLRGRRITGMSPREISHLGLVRSFQVARLFPSMTVEENLRLPLLSRRSGRSGNEGQPGRDRIEDLLDVTRLARLRRLPAGQLSGGQQALLQLAMGFTFDEVTCYVLDEPFAGIHPSIKETMLDLVRVKNASDAVTVLLVSHEMRVVRQLCTSVTVLAEGEVLKEGSIDEVTSDGRVIDAYLGRGTR